MNGAGASHCGFALATGVFDDDSHAVPAIVVVEVAHDPDAGMIHFDDGGEALGGSEPEDWNADGLGKRIAIHGDDGEGVAGKGEAANLGGAGVEDVKENAFAGFHADRFAVAEHASVDGEGIVADFESVRQAAGEGGFHFALAGIFEFGDGLGGREEVLRHIAAAAEGGLKFF